MRVCRVLTATSSPGRRGTPARHDGLSSPDVRTHEIVQHITGSRDARAPLAVGQMA
jgi:hypothetical protein